MLLLGIEHLDGNDSDSNNWLQRELYTSLLRDPNKPDPMAEHEVAQEASAGR